MPSIEVLRKRYCWIMAMTIIPFTFSWGQFSPGELSSPHAHLEGTQNCTQCHEVGNEISGKKCLTCHEEISAGVQGKHGFHFSHENETCVSCHKEHLGRNARTVRFDEKSFNHWESGFSLTGRHKEIACRACHTREKVSNPTVIALLDRHQHDTFLGLNARCVACHRDPHKGKFKQECSSCHTTTSWKQVQQFNHASTSFPLAGAHKNADCRKCHTALAANDQVKNFTTASFTDCTPCHQTPHRSRFGDAKCSSCHDPEKWKNALAKPFNHTLTRYPLRGKHSRLSCERCHQQTQRMTFTATYLRPFGQCTDCHTDKHQGQFLAKYKNNCSSCHTEEEYTPSIYTMVRHDSSNFILTGSHRAVPCGRCHRTNPSGTLTFHFENLRCAACHTDVHRGQFASVMKDGNCDRCHTTTSWRQGTYDHGSTTFPLIGKHAVVNCVRCHPESTTATNKDGSRKFSKVSPACESCHPDVHAGQFVTDGATNCSRCHSPERWTPSGFRHEVQSSFSLTGAHANVACAKCHHEEKTAAGKNFIRFKPLASTCESCHQQGSIK